MPFVSIKLIANALFINGSNIWLCPRVYFNVYTILYMFRIYTQ